MPEKYKTIRKALDEARFGNRLVNSLAWEAVHGSLDRSLNITRWVRDLAGPAADEAMRKAWLEANAVVYGIEDADLVALDAGRSAAEAVLNQTEAADDEALEEAMSAARVKLEEAVSAARVKLEEAVSACKEALEEAVSAARVKLEEAVSADPEELEEAVSTALKELEEAVSTALKELDPDRYATQVAQYMRHLTSDD
jgi:molecular chaperone DnaK (HSP70)